jgi:acetyltransferase-like isoleucine patch superfamily enzyme
VTQVSKILKIFGVTRGDEAAIGPRQTALEYLLASGVRSFLRLLANHCIIPSLRIKLFRWSGVAIGRGVQINMNVNFLDGFRRGYIKIEDEVAIAPMVSLVAESHPNNSILLTVYGMHSAARVVIKKGAWLGVGAVILPGVTVGEAAVVGANAVVTEDVDDYAIMAGVPARKIGDVRHRPATSGSAG